MKFSLPPVLLEAIRRIAYLEFFPFRFWRITYNRPGLYRLMRLERRRNLLAVLTVLITHMDIPTGRIIRPVGYDDGQVVFADCSLSWLAGAANVSQRTLCRVLADLDAVGWIERQPQKMLPGPEYGTLAVASVVRTVTDKFFNSLGLTQILSRDREYFKQSRKESFVKHLCKIVWRSFKFKYIADIKRQHNGASRKNASLLLPIGYG